MPTGETRHTCGETVPVIYCSQVDAFNNPEWCPRCQQKFFPTNMRFEDDPSDHSIEEYEQKYGPLIRRNKNGN